MSIAGVDVHVDWSLLVIFGLIATSLAFGVFPAWHPPGARDLPGPSRYSRPSPFSGSVLLHDLDRDRYLSSAELASRQGNWLAMDFDRDGRIARDEFRVLGRPAGREQH